MYIKFEIQSRNEAGEVVFTGTASEREASFLLEVGVNFLLANGAMPMLKGDSDTPTAEPSTLQ